MSSYLPPANTEIANLISDISNIFIVNHSVVKHNMIIPYFVELQGILSFSKFYPATSISNSDLNFAVSLSSYTIVFSTSLRTNCSPYANGSLTCFSINSLISSILCRLPSLSASYARTSCRCSFSL